ncbi:MAG TPA: hypothetical protein VLM82_03015, partial [Acidobacteriota bacterium]|nr:hypothetical protein [Acidobacteriota bacterium]
STNRLQTIVIKGTGFGDIQPELMELGDGSVNTVGGGDTPVIKIRDDGWKGWGAGVRDSPETGWCIIGIILESWSDTEIVLGGFGTVLFTRSQYSFNVGDPMRVTVITSGGSAEYRTTAVAGSDTLSPSGEAPVISSVSPISTDRLQTILIKGSGFGDIQPQLMELGDDSVNTVGGGKDLPGLGNTPIIQVHNEVPGYNYWQAGVRDSPQSGACVIGIILVKWSDTEIVLGGFGAALDSFSRWSLNVGDPIRIVVITSGGKTEYKTTVVAGSVTPPDDYPNSTLPIPELAISCQCTPTFSDFRAKISGSLTYNGTGLAGVPILLSYSVSGGNSWEELTLVNTDDNGDFLAQWMLFVTGNYLLKAEWNGNSNISRTNTEISFSVTPSDEQNLISVTSTSTISAFAFNSTSEQVVFNVNGPSGTTGQVHVYVPKSLIADVSNIQVFLDGEQLAYNSELTGDSWLVTFTYTHSTHEVSVNLNNKYSTTTNGNQTDQWTTYGQIIALSGIAAVLLILTSLKLRQKRSKALLKTN